MNNQQCKDCNYFLQHYTLNKRGLLQVYCGHCTFSWAKRKRPDSKVCEHFTPGTADTEAFVTKEYLSKELLEHVLRLELLPEINEFIQNDNNG